MDFSNFPMDEQVCIVEFGSFGYDNSQIVYKWREQSDKAITIEADDLRLSQFEFKYHEYSSRNVSYTSGITTVLTMTTFAISSRQQIPKVSYPSAMDWFVLACYFFVFFALVEYAAVNYFTKRSEAGKAPPPQNLEAPPAKRARLNSGNNNQCDQQSDSITQSQQQQQSHQHGILSQHDFPQEAREDLPPFENMNSFFIRFIVCLCGSVQYKTYKLDHITTQFNSVSHIDELCRVGFPALFMLFNLIYWSIYFPRD
ncbi:gamma-aminobutyric acid receptor subunit alpha-5-like isoform X2 [Convolutriloba macropyga]|uniref:gamma-aminobutyric acid receptor subunit alpha-5-like isoform X2 n=1 Tax=Convolutriloba macropyga TaxID=536237 RepID=UPI003F523021